MRQRAKAPSKKIPKALIEGLQVIQDEFEWQGFVADADIAEGEKETQDVGEKTESTDEEDDGDENEEFYTNLDYDREDLEIALGTFISYLIRKKVVRKEEFVHEPSFPDVLDKFFGEDHEIVKAARSFEEFIEGYFGLVAYENMKAAHSEFMGIKEFLQKELSVLEHD